MRRFWLFGVALGVLGLALHSSPASAVVVSGYVRTCPAGDAVEGITVNLFRNGSLYSAATTNAAGYYQVDLWELNCNEDWITATIGTAYPPTLYAEYHHDYAASQKGSSCYVQRARGVNCNGTGMPDLQFRCGSGALPCPSE